MPHALVTGSSGFIGRHFVQHLREQDWNVKTVDTADWEFPEDARDYFRSPGHGFFDLVIHCAAVVGGRQTIDHDPLAMAVNLELDAAMFRWAAQARPGRVVYFSSSAAYPVQLQDGRLGRGLCEEDIKLSDPGLPDQLYGWAKLTGEMLAQLAQANGVGVTVVRPFSGYGSDQDDTYPFPAFIDRALAGEDPFTIWGSGRQVRDFIHVDDIVGAVMALAEAEESGPFNLGCGRSTSMDMLARDICRAAGYTPELEHISAAPSGVHHRLSDSHRLAKFYRPLVLLETGISRALEDRARTPSD